jgi:hypothetical protein
MLKSTYLRRKDLYAAGEWVHPVVTAPGSVTSAFANPRLSGEASVALYFAGERTYEARKDL